MAQDRRTFLATLGGLTLSMGWARTALADLAEPARKKLSRIGIQLYTLRSKAEKDLAGTLAEVAKIGYKEVELAGFYNHPASEVRDLLKQNGLTAPSSHVSLEQIEKDSARTFADARTVGNQWITVPSLAGKHATVDDWKRAAADLNRAADLARAEGFRFAYHNHNMEIRRIGDVMPLEVLLANTDQSLVSYEMDIYWVVNGGGNPVELLDKHPGRFKMLHVKDSAGPPEHKMVDVGAGVIPFKTIFEHAKGIEHYFVEHDNPPDPFADAAASFNYLKNLTF
jgi:sugar phosphate isomerase/epimerase